MKFGEAAFGTRQEREVLPSRLLVLTATLRRGTPDSTRASPTATLLLEGIEAGAAELYMQWQLASNISSWKNSAATTCKEVKSLDIIYCVHVGRQRSLPPL